MPPTDESTDAGTARATRTDRGPGPGSRAATGLDPGAGTDCEDTLDLRLSDELIALFAGDTGSRPGTAEGTRDGTVEGAPDRSSEGTPAGDDLLDRVGGWGPARTPAGVLLLVPVRPGRDLPLVHRWMNDPAVAEFWELAGPESVVEEHLLRQLDGDGRSVPCLGVLDGTPMSYWEIYRADLDPLARHYPARPHDTGVHLLVGGVADRGRGLGSTLLRAVADQVLDKRPSCARVVAEPDLRNTPSVSAFLSAGFRFSAEVDLPDKRAALMVRDRALRDLL
ncbi:GNAT family N-acetyltransferase [Streptomyces populi]|uniref:Lysine N-acyltransferase MbtK n=1 Tax=Streptomyces populi TaxID=2058924 RepID=A0A2I0SRN9_9ACTN|nr:GNAT family N-acetyltransferase [Streptomyces populi]PKT72588.1 GNAT family N-acetyltransferase [Streptomyces populi]